MQIVIDIPDGLYHKMTKTYNELTWEECMLILDKIEKNSTALPKGHGRLIDADKLSFKLNEAQIEGTDTYKGLGEAKQIVEDAPTIIEADKEGT